MTRITLRQLLDHAAENDYGVPAFNISNMEQGLAIMAAADEANAPVILQASRGARAYANDIVLARLIDALVEIYPHIPVCMHLDHGNNLATCVTAIQNGFTSVMMDGSLMADGTTPADYAYNAGITRRCGMGIAAIHEQIIDPRDDGDTTARAFDRETELLYALFIRQGEKLAGRTTHNDAVRAVLDLPVDDGPETVPIDREIVIERRDDRHVNAFETHAVSGSYNILYIILPHFRDE